MDITDGMWTPEQKRAALELALQSNTLARSDQLRNFLKYICEVEIAGHGPDLNEYVVGVEALGRPDGYSTATDSTVRSRAHTLRTKLQEFYEKEAPDAPLRIDLPKGSYVPRFVKGNGGAETRGCPPARRRYPGMIAAFLLGAALAVSGIWLAQKGQNGGSAATHEAWGSLADSAAQVALVLSAPAHMAIYAYPQGVVPADVVSQPLAPEVKSWYEQHYVPPKGTRVMMHATTNSVQMGNVAGAIALTSILNRFGAGYQVLAETGLPVTALRDRHVLLLGNSEYSHLAERLLDRAVFSVRYDAATHERAVMARAKSGAYEVRYLPERDSRGHQAAAFGLISVLSGEGWIAGAKRVVVFSGTSSAALQSGAEFFCSEQSLAGLRKIFAKEGHAGFPTSYQVVIRCRTDNVRLLSYSYEAHLVLPVPLR